MDIKLPTSFEELTERLEEMQAEALESGEYFSYSDMEEMLTKESEREANELITESENHYYSNPRFAQIAFKKNRKTPAEFDDSYLSSSSLAYDLLNEISILLFALRDKNGNIKLKDISQDRKDKIINAANYYIKEAIIDLPKELTAHIETKPQEHYLGSSMTRLEELLKIRQMLITYLLPSPDKNYRYLHIASA